jgi:hypothetical protein
MLDEAVLLRRGSSKEAKMSEKKVSSPQSDEVSTVIPVFVCGRTENGHAFHELALTVVVDVGGGIIKLDSPVTVGLRLLATNENTNQNVECSVVHTLGVRNGKTQARIAFDKPSPNFWGINFVREIVNADQNKRSGPKHFMDVGHPLTPDMYRRLMGRTN